MTKANKPFTMKRGEKALRENDLFDDFVLISMLIFGISLFVGGWFGFVFGIILQVVGEEINRYSVLICAFAVLVGSMALRYFHNEIR